jgi:hypothetical protein
MGEMTERSLVALIVAGRIDDAVRLARDSSVECVADQLDYDTLAEYAEAASSFLQAWCRALSPLPRLQAADWAAGQYLTSLVHLDRSYGIAADLVLEAQAAAVHYLASSLRDTWALADGPDAELAPTVVERLAGYADWLDGLDFELVRRTGSESV